MIPYIFCLVQGILKKSGTISGSLNIESNTAERFENLYEFGNYDPEIIDFYTEDDIEQDLWTKIIGEVKFGDFSQKVRND